MRALIRSPRHLYYGHMRVCTRSCGTPARVRCARARARMVITLRHGRSSSRRCEQCAERKGRYTLITDVRGDTSLKRYTECIADPLCKLQRKSVDIIGAITDQRMLVDTFASIRGPAGRVENAHLVKFYL